MNEASPLRKSPQRIYGIEAGSVGTVVVDF
jgi:hypothetical protein